MSDINTRNLAQEKLPNPWIPRSLWIVGGVLIVVAIPAYSSKPAFWSLLTVGAALVLVGLILWFVQNTKAKSIRAARAAVRKADKTFPAFRPTPDDTALPPVVPAPVSAPEPAPPSLAEIHTPVSAPEPAPPSLAEIHTPVSASVSAPEPAPPSLAEIHTPVSPPSPILRRRHGEERKKPRHRRSASAPPAVRWADNNDSTSPIAGIKSFDHREPPRRVRDSRVRLAPDHPPKQVPAIHPRHRKLGYQSASMPMPQGLPPMAGPPATTGPVFYKPPSRYPTVNAIAEERQRFWSRPETAELERTRRIGMLREAALTLGPPRDGSMVPIAVSLPRA